MLSLLGTYKRVGAKALLLVFLAGWSLGVLHGLLSHHEHGAENECSVAYTPGKAHIHDDSYANDHCDLCAFVLSSVAFWPENQWRRQARIDIYSVDHFHSTPSKVAFFFNSNFLRGPPGC